MDLLRRDHSEVHLAGRDASRAQSLARILARILSPRISAAERVFCDR